jgi:hypothetical protein
VYRVPALVGDGYVCEDDARALLEGVCGLRRRRSVAGLLLGEGWAEDCRKDDESQNRCKSLSAHRFHLSPH